MITVRRKFISFHQNDNIVHFRSFQSSCLNNVRYSLVTTSSIKITDHGQTHYRQVGIKERINNVKKCIKHKTWRQSHSFITREIKKNWPNTFSCWSEYFLRSGNLSLLMWKSASRSKDGISPSSHGESHSNIPSSSSSCFPLFSCCSSKSERSRLTGSPGCKSLW